MPKLEMDQPRTRNSAGNTVIHTYTVQPPGPAVLQKQDSRHTEADYVRDLEKVTKRRKPS
jgi:hypothetical protein